MFVRLERVDVAIIFSTYLPLSIIRNVAFIYIIRYGDYLPIVPTID